MADAFLAISGANGDKYEDDLISRTGLSTIKIIMDPTYLNKVTPSEFLNCYIVTDGNYITNGSRLVVAEDTVGAFWNATIGAFIVPKKISYRSQSFRMVGYKHHIFVQNTSNKVIPLTVQFTDGVEPKTEHTTEGFFTAPLANDPTIISKAVACPLDSVAYKIWVKKYNAVATPLASAYRPIVEQDSFNIASEGYDIEEQGTRNKLDNRTTHIVIDSSDLAQTISGFIEWELYK